MKYLPHTATSSSNPLRKLLTFIVTVAMVGVLLMFSVVAFVVILCVGVIAGAYLWWKTRELRKQMRTHSFGGSAMNGEVSERDFAPGEVIEGEVIRVSDPQDNEVDVTRRY